MKYFIFLYIVFTNILVAQKNVINGNLCDLNNTTIYLKGYNNLNEIYLDSTIVGSNGDFVLKYPKNYKGIGVLKIKDQLDYLVILNKEDFSVICKQSINENYPNTISIIKSEENKIFSDLIEINSDSHKKLQGLNYLKNLYSVNSKEQQWILNEISFQENRLDSFINKNKNKLYVYQYVVYRKLFDDLSEAVVRDKVYSNQILQKLNNLDYSNSELANSGLISKIIDGLLNLLELGNSLEEIYSDNNKFIDKILSDLSSNPSLKSEIANYLFVALEKKSIFESAKYLATKMLDDASCNLDTNSAYMYEQYRTMAVGKIVKDFAINQTSLYQLPNQRKLVIFGSSWCPKCQEEYQKWVVNYLALKAIYDLEIVYVSLDHSKSDFQQFFAKSPFPVICDYKGWESNLVKDYFVFATPTIYLLDNENKIILKPNSIEHLEAWLYTRFGK